MQNFKMKNIKNNYNLNFASKNYKLTKINLQKNEKKKQKIK